MYYNIINPCCCTNSCIRYTRIPYFGPALTCDNCGETVVGDVVDSTIHDLARIWNERMRVDEHPATKWASMQAYKEDMLSSGDEEVKHNHA